MSLKRAEGASEGPSEDRARRRGVRLKSWPRTTDLVSLGLLAGTFALSALVYRQLPPIMAVHFDAAGRPNGWASRGVAAFLVPTIILGVWLLLRLAPLAVRHGPSRLRLRLSPIGVMGLFTVVLGSAIHLYVIRVALHPASLRAGLAGWILALTSLALALALPRTRRNPIMGIRTTWTLASDENWGRTHRVAGGAFALAGVVALSVALVAPVSGTGLAIASFIAAAIGSSAYSYVLARRLGHRPTTR